MSIKGTAAYARIDGLPPLVRRAVEVARRAGFENSCRPEQGCLLYALAGGAQNIGETGTGCGVGLARLASGARPGTTVMSVERDPAGVELVWPGGTIVIDDLTPAAHWLPHPGLDTAEQRLAPDFAALVATRRFPA